MSNDTLSTHWLQRALTSAAAAGASTGRLRLEIGLAESDPDVTVHRDSYLSLWERLVEIDGDRSLPIRAAARATLERTDVLAFACVTCATLGEAIQRLHEYLHGWTQAIQVRLLPHDDGSQTLELRRPQPTTRFGAALADEFMLADSMNLARWMTGTRCAAQEVLFMHAAPSDVRAHRAHFAGPVRFGAPRCGLRFSRETLALPLLRHDPWIAAYAHTSVQEEARRARASQPPAGAAAEVLRQLAVSFESAVPTFETVATRLGTTPRTLRRRLREESTSYRELLEVARRDEAVRLVGSTGRAIAEIASMLGFAQQSSFHRAFTRWTGKAPSVFRDESAAHTERGERAKTAER